MDVANVCAFSCNRRLTDIDPILLSFAAGDYVLEAGLSMMSIEKVEERLHVVHRVEEIRRACPLAHPGASFDFCLSFPEGGLAEFFDHKEKIQKVFQHEGDRIMCFLTKAERKVLLHTPLSDVVHKFEARHQKSIICSHLSKWVSEETASNIVNHPACQLRIQREDDESATAMKLLKFWNEKDDCEARELDLRQTISSAGYGIYVSPKKKAFQLYIQGDVDCDAEEVVCIEKLLQSTSWNWYDFGWKGQFDYRRQLCALTKFEELWTESQMTSEECVKEAISRARYLHVSVLDETESWDYKQLTKGFWGRQLSQ